MQRFPIAQQWLSRCEYVVVLYLWRTNPRVCVCWCLLWKQCGREETFKTTTVEIVWGVMCGFEQQFFLWLPLHLTFSWLPSTNNNNSNYLISVFFLPSWQTLTFNPIPPTFTLRHINQYENIFSGICSKEHFIKTKQRKTHTRIRHEHVNVSELVLCKPPETSHLLSIQNYGAKCVCISMCAFVLVWDVMDAQWESKRETTQSVQHKNHNTSVHTQRGHSHWWWWEWGLKELGVESIKDMFETCTRPDWQAGRGSETSYFALVALLSIFRTAWAMASRSMP